MDLPSDGRKKLRLGKLKSKFFKDFSQKSAYMYMSAHTLQGPVPTVDLRTPEENATTQHNVYTLATERYHFEPYLSQPTAPGRESTTRPNMRFFSKIT